MPADNPPEAVVLQVYGLAGGRNLDGVGRRGIARYNRDPFGRPHQPTRTGQINQRMDMIPARLARLENHPEIVERSQLDIKCVLDKAAIHPAFAHGEFRTRHQDANPRQLRRGQHPRPGVHRSELAGDGHGLVDRQPLVRELHIKERHPAHTDKGFKIMLTVGLNNRRVDKRSRNKAEGQNDRNHTTPHPDLPPQGGKELETSLLLQGGRHWKLTTSHYHPRFKGGKNPVHPVILQIPIRFGAGLSASAEYRAVSPGRYQSNT